MGPIFLFANGASPGRSPDSTGSGTNGRVVATDRVRRRRFLSKDRGGPPTTGGCGGLGPFARALQGGADRRGSACDPARESPVARPHSTPLRPPGGPAQGTDPGEIGATLLAPGGTGRSGT